MRLLLFLLLTEVSLLLSAQTAEQNHTKYQTYRDRIKYFYTIGTSPGECQYASISGMFPPRVKRLNFGGDQSIEMAWFTSVMATEYFIRSKDGQDVSTTLKELYYALMAYKRLDECETREPWNKPKAKFDGFFMRSDIPSDTFVQENLSGFNKDLTPADTFLSRPPGMPCWVEKIRYSNHDMSQDQAIHILMAFALISRCLPDTNLVFPGLNGEEISFNFNAFAKDAADKLIHYIMNDRQINGTKPWVIYNPDGEKAHMGAAAGVFAYAFCRAGQYITGNVYMPDLGMKVKGRVVWEVAKIPTPNEWNTSMASILAAIGDSWGSTEGTDKAIFSASKKYDWDTFYILLWQVLHNKKSGYLDKEKLLNQLNLAPPNGTYYYGEEELTFAGGEKAGKPEGGWCSNNRFRNTIKEQQGRENYKGNYNGLDYMLLYNLYHICYQPCKY